MSAMKLIETNLSETSVRMRFADDADHEKATQWLEFQIPLALLREPHSGTSPLGNLDRRFLAEVHLAALRYVRDAMTPELQKLQVLAASMR